MSSEMFFHPTSSMAPFLVAPAIQSTEEGGMVVPSVTLIPSPFSSRRATLYIEPCDRVIDREWEALKKRQEENGKGEVRYEDFFVLPTPLPIDGQPSPSFPAILPCKVVPLVDEDSSKKPEGPYHQLVFLFDETATLFTSLFCSLTRANFTMKSARRHLMETRFSFKYAKRPVRSDFVGINPYKYQKMNQIPSSGYITRKDHLHRTLEERRRRSTDALSSFEAQYNGGVAVTPRGWILPEEMAACTEELRKEENRKKLFIVKKVGGTGGLDITLTTGGPSVSLERCMDIINTPKKTNTDKETPSQNAEAAAKEKRPIGFEHSIKNSNIFLVQEYIDRPYLINGHKFDLRVYVVITSYYPFRMYVYKEGLVRIATSPYHHQEEVASVDALTAHLTNFTLNKASEGFTSEGGTAEETFSSYKWPLAALRVYMEEKESTEQSDSSKEASWATVWRRVQRLLVEVFQSIAPRVRNELDEIDTAQKEKFRVPSSKESVQEGTATTVTPTDGTTVTLPPGDPPCTLHGISPYFQLFGVDVMLQRSSADPRQLYPVLVEINGMPSLSSHYSYVDQCIKANLVADTLNLVGLTSPLLRPGTGGARSHEGPDSGIPSDWPRVAQDACRTLMEEERRAPHFDRVFPTADGWDVHGGGDDTRLTALDHLLCQFVKYVQK